MSFGTFLFYRFEAFFVLEGVLGLEWGNGIFLMVVYAERVRS